MARKTRKNRRHKGQSNWQPIIIWSSFIVLLGLMTFGYFSLKGEPFNSETMCPEAGPDGVTVLLIDVSDPLSFSQEAKFKRLLRSNTKPIVPKRHRLDAYLVPEAGEKPPLLFSICNPGNIETASTSEKLNQNARAFKIKWDNFLTELQTALDEVAQQTTNESSPISEALDYATSNSLPPIEMTLDNPRDYRVFIVSDMLQNTSKLSVFGSPGINQDSKIDHALLYGGETYVFNLKSDKYNDKQTSGLLLFWEQTFDKAGSRLMTWENW